MNRDDRPATGQAARAAATFRLTYLSLMLPEPARHKAGEKMDNPKSYLAELLEKGARDSSKGFLPELIMKALAPSAPDYLLENTKADIEAILLLKDKEQLKRLLERHTQRLQETKEYIRKEHIEMPYPQMVYDFLRDFYAYIDGIDRWVISAIKKGKLNCEKGRELQNKRDGLFNRWCVIYRAETDFFAEKLKQAEKKMSEAELASLKPAETKQNATPAKIINIENFKGVLGDIQAENIQTGDYASIHKHPVNSEKKKGIVRKLLKIIGAIVAFFAALLTTLHLLGWLEPIKEFITKILWPK